MPVSAMDLALALETSIAARNLPTGARRPRANVTLREIDGAAAAGSRAVDFENPSLL
jgi:hypothetical protein